MNSVDIVLLSFLIMVAGLFGTPVFSYGDSGCTTSECHQGIETIRDTNSKMMQEIITRGKGLGDDEGCIVCHGGSPAEATAEKAHKGHFFLPDPGSPWGNDLSCGQCHSDLVKRQWNSLMMTEAGKVQGTAWAFGSLTGYGHKWANYDAKNPEDGSDRLGTADYCEYMDKLAKKEPGAFPQSHEALPSPPLSSDDVKGKPGKGANTYLRTDCQRCHLGVRGRQERGDYRGMGCSACHIPYSNDGFYEGSDKSIDGTKEGHYLVHRIQGTRKVKNSHNGVKWSGIPVETCTTCHDRGKRIGVSFQGLMEKAYSSPYSDDGKTQPKLHSKKYMAMKLDVHHKKGMVCQDCHTSNDVHGDGFLAGSTLGQVEIECADCHGTTDKYPWELPLGFGDEFSDTPIEGVGRGLAKEKLAGSEDGTVYKTNEGLLRTARGNPLTNVEKKGNEVIVHTAAGKDLVLIPLKKAATEKTISKEGSVAMVNIRPHMQRLECYTCHAKWAPQCYGCHVKIDYSDGKKSFDWVAAGRKHQTLGKDSPGREDGFKTTLAGKVTEERSYLRWEDPALGVNGEGRICPLIPGCQVSATILDKNGKAIVKNHIFRTEAGSEGSGQTGQLGSDMSPVNPHTTTKEARPCESCHGSAKAAGYGIGGGTLMRNPGVETQVDLANSSNEIIPEKTTVQIEAINGLEADWSRFVTEDGRQLQTVGSHFSRSRPLNNRERAILDRRGVCLACHQEIPDQSLPISVLAHVAAVAGMRPETSSQHNDLVNKLVLLAAWVQVGGPVAGGLVLVFLLCFWLIFRQRIKSWLRNKLNEEEINS